MQRITLSWLEYDLLWEHLQLGAQPTVLAIDRHGVTTEQRARLREQGWSTLAAKGLGTPGAFHRDLEQSLRLLANPRWEIDGRLHLDASPRTSTLIAANADRAVLAVLRPDEFTLYRLAPTGLAQAAVEQLPGHPPGNGVSITLPADTLDAVAEVAGEDRLRLQRELVGRGLDRADARKVTEVLGSVIRFGQFGVSGKDRTGRRTRGSHVVTWYDTPGGRYLFTRRTSGGQPWATLAPGSDAALRQQLTELLDEVRAA